jgi:chromosomal replication initiator protein
VAAQDDTIAQVWDRAVEQLSTDPSTTAQQLAFVRLARPVGLLDGTVLLSVDNVFTKDYLETRVRNELLAVLTTILGTEARLP